MVIAYSGYSAPGPDWLPHCGSSVSNQARCGAGKGLEALRLVTSPGLDDARYVYVCAIALNSTGKPESVPGLCPGRFQEPLPGMPGKTRPGLGKDVITFYPD